MILYPLSQLYFAKAPILYVCWFLLDVSEVRISVLPYMRSLPVTDRMLCGANVGSGQRISSHFGVESLQEPLSRHVRFGMPLSLCELVQEYRTSDPKWVALDKYRTVPYGIWVREPQSMSGIWNVSTVRRGNKKDRTYNHNQALHHSIIRCPSTWASIDHVKRNQGHNDIQLLNERCSHIRPQMILVAHVASRKWSL